MVSTIHTHAAYASGFDNDDFSSGKYADTWWADLFCMTIYMANPRGEVKKYDPRTKQTMVIANDIYFDPNHPNR